jgi:hypothetical protein
VLGVLFDDGEGGRVGFLCGEGGAEIPIEGCDLDFDLVDVMELHASLPSEISSVVCLEVVDVALLEGKGKGEGGIKESRIKTRCSMIDCANS